METAGLRAKDGLLSAWESPFSRISFKLCDAGVHGRVRFQHIEHLQYQNSAVSSQHLDLPRPCKQTSHLENPTR